MTDFLEHSEALGRLRDELELLKAGNEIIAEHEQTAKSALDTSHRLASANQELAERITLVADQLERTATTVEGQFSALHNAATTTSQEYQSLLADLSQLDVVAKVTATESRLGEIQQVLIDKVLEIVGLLNAQAETTAELKQAQTQLLSLTSPLREQLTNQERAIANAELKATERASLIEERLDALFLAILSPLQDQLNAQKQTIMDAEQKTGERFANLTSLTSDLRQSLEARITALRDLLEAQSDQLNTSETEGIARLKSLDQHLIRLDRVSGDIQQDIRSQHAQLEQFQVLVESQALALQAVDNKVTDQGDKLILRLDKAESMTLKAERQIVEQREEIQRLLERVAEGQRAQSELHRQLESVHKTARNSSNYAIITVVAQIGLLVLFVLLLLFVVLRNVPA